MEDLKNQIDKQIEILKRMISENENKEEISKEKEKLDKLLEKYINKLN